MNQIRRSDYVEAALWDRSSCACEMLHQNPEWSDYWIRRSRRRNERYSRQYSKCLQILRQTTAIPFGSGVKLIAEVVIYS